VEREQLVRKINARAGNASLHMPDVDLVSACYEVFGSATASHLSGEFSVAIYDPRKRCVLLARDPFGRRALLYSRCRDSWIISNELPALVAHPDCSGELSKVAIGDFLMFGWHDLHDKSLTAFESIRSVVPGEQITLEQASSTAERHWNFPEASESQSRCDVRGYAEGLRFQLRRAVQERLDCSTVVVSMSGGLDSTAIAAFAKEARPLVGHGTRIILETNVHEPNSEEERCARLASSYLGLPHRVRTHSLDAVFEPWPATWAPHRQIAPVAIFNHDRDLALEAQVRMVGSAADSLFAHDSATFLGIARSYGLRAALASRHELRRSFGRKMSWGTGFLSSTRAPKADAGNEGWQFPKWLNPDFVREYGLQDRWRDFWQWSPVATREQPHPSIVRWLGWPNWFCGNMFVGIDFCPAEVVDPFLDLGLLRFIQSIPSEPWLRDKWIMREAVSDMLPPEIVTRRKVIAGDVFQKPLASVPAALVDDWTAEEGIEEYVMRKSVRSFDAEMEPAERLVHLHPFFLNKWINSRRQW
jgi:hypothetical protein